MRTYKKLLTLLLCGLLAATVASAQTLVLRHANGALTQMPLTSETSITFDDGKTVVGNRAYAASDIVSIAYKDETMPVEGDVNGDTQVNVGDIMAIINYMVGQANMGVDVADVNGDGNVNVGDVMSVINIMAGYNADGRLTDTTPTQQPPSAQSQNVGEAFYVYRNDANLNAFFREEVTSIDFSNVDADGNVYNNIVSQVVNTPDSTYIIPIAATDSVGFVQPETIYKEDAIQLTGSLFDYLISADGMTLTFSPTLPGTLTPRVGDNIVTMELTDKLPCGFVGKVREVSTGQSGIDVACDSIEVTDVVEKFYGVVIMGDESISYARKKSLRRAPSYYSNNYDLPNTPINIPIDISGYITKKKIFDINGKAEINVNIVPRTAVKVTLVVDGIRSHTNIHVASRLVTTTNIGICGEASKELKLNLLPNDGNYIGPWGIPLYLALGPKLELTGDILADFTVKATIDVSSDIVYYPQSLAIPALSPIVNSNTGTVKVSNFDVSFDRIGAQGSLRAGAFFRCGVSVGDHKKAWVGLEADGGAKCDVDLMFDVARLREADLSTALYDELKSMCDLEVKPFFGLHFMGSVKDDNYTFKLGKEFDDFGATWFKGGLIPTFSDTEMTSAASGALSASASTNITGSCPIPYSVGFSLFNSDKTLVQKPVYQKEKYSIFNSFPSYKATFDNLKSDEKYTVYPTVKLFGYDMLASPSAEFTMHFPVSLNSFKVTNAQYQNDGFSHEGQAYDYCFNVSVAATLDAEAEGIADWGYAYLDPNGNEALISLSQFGHSYIDTRYAYYRNEPHSTCTLYAYVKYVGSNAIVYGEPHDYPLDYQGETSCPDANHPHWIDLGLPSGTQWRCCNEGASTPEGYGGYYTFDEAQAYNPPSFDQIHELVYNNCTSVWTTQNGVNGRKFTGPNGSSVFLPAAGYGFGSGSLGSGYYWSSTPLGDSAYYLYFLSNRADWSVSDYRTFGWSVRPVR